MVQFKAFLLLAVSLVVTLLRRFFSRRGVGIPAFRENYDADGLPPVTVDERAVLTSFQRCIACGLCDRGEGERMAASGGVYRGVMSLMLASSRSMPDFRASAQAFSYVPDAVLAEKEALCPAFVPMRQIARFVAAKADAVGGPFIVAKGSPGPAGAHLPASDEAPTAARSSRSPARA